MPILDLQRMREMICAEGSDAWSFRRLARSYLQSYEITWENYLHNITHFLVMSLAIYYGKRQSQGSHLVNLLW